MSVRIYLEKFVSMSPQLTLVLQSIEQLTLVLQSLDCLLIFFYIEHQGHIITTILYDVLKIKITYR